MYWIPRKTGHNPLFEVHTFSYLKDKLPYSLGKGNLNPKTILSGTAHGVFTLKATNGSFNQHMLYFQYCVKANSGSKWACSDAISVNTSLLER